MIISTGTRITLALATGIGACSTAQAQDRAADKNWYVAVAGTVTATSDPRTVIFNAPVAPAQLTIRDDLKSPGYGGLIALGHRFGSFRLEAEAGHTYDMARAYTTVSPITIELAARGGFAVARYMANAYFDVPTGGGAIEPYLGGGIGYASYREKTFAARAFAPTAPQIQLIDDRLHHLAWQAIAGVAVSVSPQVRLTLQGRYLDVGKANGQDTRGQPITTRLKGLNFDAGVRFAF
jgi:opacity protein-like surface antigen